MRIISGNYKGYSIHPHKNFKSRPTTDYCKESIFNILNNYFDIENIEVLDLFAGTGSISFEFASRGSSKVVCVDNNSLYISQIKKQSINFEMGNLFPVRQDAILFLNITNEEYDIIFADPPYDYNKYELLINTIFKRKLLKINGWLIIEHSSKVKFINHPSFKEERTYGQSKITIFKEVK